MSVDPELRAQLRAGFAAQKKQASYNTDPRLWAKDKLGVHLWSVQKEIIESVRDNKRTTVASCHGSGKALHVNTPIPVPTKPGQPQDYTTMWHVRPGDRVLDHQGLPTRVVAVTEDHEYLSHEMWFLHTRAGKDAQASAGSTQDQNNTGQDATASVLTASTEHIWRVLTPQAQARIKTLCKRRGISEPDWSYWMHRTVKVNTRQMYDHANASLIREHMIIPAERLIITALETGAQGGSPTLSHLMARYGTVDRQGRVCLRTDAPVRAKASRNNMSLANRLQAEAITAPTGIRSGSYPQALIQAERELRDAGVKTTVARHRRGYTYTYELSVISDPSSLLCAYTPCGPHEDDMNVYDAQAIMLQAADIKNGVPPKGGWRNTNVLQPRVERVKCIQVDNDLNMYLAGRQHIPTHNSMIASVAASWWIDTHPPGTAIVVSTAPTYPQVHAILWEEIRKHHNRAKANGTPLPGSVTMADNWNLPDGILAGQGRKPKDGDQHAFQGIHRRFVLVIIDEACGVPSELWTGAEAITTNDGCRILVIGNPDDRDTDFGKSFEDPSVAHMWHRIRIPASVTPNLTGEPVPPLLNEVLVSKGWCDDALARWGADDPRYISKVLAKFPEANEASLFTPAVIATGFEPNGKHAIEPPHTLYFGVDCARYGGDLNALVCFDGYDARVIESWGGMDTVSSAMKALGLIEDEIQTYRMKWREVPNLKIRADIRVDAVGLGAGVVDTMAAKRAEIEQQLKRDGVDELPWFTVREMQGSAAPPKDMGGSIQGYGNARAYWYDQTKHLMRADAVNVQEHAKLKDELGGIRYKYKNGKLYIESKEEMRDRGVKSPDFADAFVYAVAPVYEGLPTGSTVSAEASSLERDAVEEDLLMMKENQIAPY
jgi:hypothetical protein